MKIKIYFLIVILLSIFGCKPQEKIVENITCDGKISLQYDRIKIGDEDKPIAKKNSQSVTIYFLSSYNDSIQGFINKHLLYDKFLKQDDNSHNLSENFVYDYSKDSGLPILKIVSKTDDTCFDISIDKKYKLVYVFKNDGKWIVRFSNIYYVN